MSFLSRSSLFFCVVSFSGAMVVLGARDMLRHLKAPAQHEIERSDKLVHALRGDELFRAQAKYDQPNQNLPQRQIGSYLPDYDLKKIKSFLLNLIGGTHEDVAEAKSGDTSKSAE
jgi:hypothetical protein